MEGRAKIVGLEDALAAMRAAFPKDPEQQRRLLNATMGQATKKTILPSAKRRSFRGDSSGALAEALSVRAQSKAATLRKGVAAGVYITPVRRHIKAMSLYISHYFTAKGRAAPASFVRSGIKHGHLIEFGTKRSAAQPFLWPAAQSRVGSFRRVFAGILRKKTESAVRRKARKKAKR